jgi:hypothetical protein
MNGFDTHEVAAIVNAACLLGEWAELTPESLADEIAQWRTQQQPIAERVRKLTQRQLDNLLHALGVDAANQ